MERLPPAGGRKASAPTSCCCPPCLAPPCISLTCTPPHLPPTCIAMQPVMLLHGVDVGSSRFFKRPVVKRAADFAAAAHRRAPGRGGWVVWVAWQGCGAVGPAFCIPPAPYNNCPVFYPLGCAPPKLLPVVAAGCGCARRGSRT